jgi:hypothetical protein
MKAHVDDYHSLYSTKLTCEVDSNGNVVTHIVGLEIKLLQLALQQMNMTFHVTNIDGCELRESRYGNLLDYMLTKQIYIFLGSQACHELLVPFFDTTSVYNMDSVRWYVPCSDKYPRWSSMYRILSVELWVVLIISIVIVAVSTTLLGRYSCTSEWQVYKTLTSSLTNVWAVILGVGVSTIPRTPSLRSLFLAWVFFSIAFSTVFLAFLTTYLVDSGYKTPIQNMDELFVSGMKLAYDPVHRFIFEHGDQTYALNVRRNQVICPSMEVCVNWAMYYKNMSVFLPDYHFKYHVCNGDLVDNNGKPLLCGLDDGVVSNPGAVMVMFYGEPLLKRVNEIFDRVVEAGLYNSWISQIMNQDKIAVQKIAIVNPIDEYYNFNLYHLQPAFYLLLMGLCLSVFCFVIEVFCYRSLKKRKENF